MNIQQPNIAATFSRWPHRAAVLLVCVTFPLLWIGGLVTTTGSGMAVPDWPTTYGYNPFAYPVSTWFNGPRDIFYEHSHRMFVSVVATATILTVAAIFWLDRRRWMRWLVVGAVLLIVVQAVIGGLRVTLDERTLAQLHGCVGPLFFALTVAIATFTSKWWMSAEARRDPRAGRLQRLAAATVAIAYLQLVLGTFIRHVSSSTSTGEFRFFLIFHLLVAAVLTAHVALLGIRVLRRYSAERLLVRPALVLVALICVQLCLGAGTWLTHYGPPAVLNNIGWFSNSRWVAGYTVSEGSMWETHITTAHVAVGSLILGISLALALRTLRLLASGPIASTAERKLAEVIA